MKTVLITGGNRGLGLEFVKQYSQLGYKIIVTCRNPNEAKELNTLKENSKTDIKIHTLDVTNHEEIDLLSKSLSNKPIDIIINNAGIIGPFPIFEHIFTISVYFIIFFCIHNVVFSYFNILLVLICLLILLVLRL